MANTTRVQIRAFAFGGSNFLVRHQNFQGEINEFDQNHVGDFLFDMITDSEEIANVVHNTVRFRGTEPFQTHFLRHKNFRVLLEEQPATDAPDFELFQKDSTFFVKTALSDVFVDKGRSFEAKNFADHFIRHKDLHLFVNTDLNSTQDKRDATFQLETV